MSKRNLVRWQEVLAYLRGRGDWVVPKDIATDLDIPRGTVSDLLAVLVHREQVEMHPLRRGHYRLTSDGEASL